jgi:hypothetical protein
MFTKLYLDTTNPQNKITDDIIKNSILSILFHTFIYTFFCNIISYIFYNKSLSYNINKRLVLYLVLIMIIGYIGRYYHVNDVYMAYNKDLEKTRNHLDKLYISWLFIS